MKARNRLTTVLALLAAGCGAARSAPPSDERQIMQAALAYEAGLPHERTPVCVSSRTEGATFDRDREQIRSMREASRRNPADAELRRLAGAGNSVSYGWKAPGISFDRAPRVEGPLAERLDAAARRLLDHETGQGAALAVDPATVPAPLQRTQFLSSCSALTLSAPAIDGDVAFIETGYVCGGLCGNGWLYALERGQGGWRIVAVAFTWVS